MDMDMYGTDDPCTDHSESQQGAPTGWAPWLSLTAPLRQRSIPAASACFSWTKEGTRCANIGSQRPIKA